MAVLDQDPFAELTHHDPDAQRVSDAIDDALKVEKKKRDKAEKNQVKVLLLGQGESGKSTTLKNFRLAYDPEGWQEERASWRAVIQLNVCRSVHILLADSTDELLNLRLAPLKRVEADLMRRLGAASYEDTPDGQPPEVYLRAMTSIPQANDAEAQAVLFACLSDIQTLYASAKSQRSQDGRGIEESSGFFLNDVERICAPDYTPSDEDVMRARLRTTGVQEWRIRFHNTTSTLGLNAAYGQDWVIYDVGGCRTARHAWLPFFENINAIIFLAPLSPFDQTLAEDPSVNRLDDTIRIWKFITASKLLSRTTLVVFLNKCDLLRRKLRKGVRFADYVTTYDGENEAGVVVKWMRDKFKDVAKSNAPAGTNRPVYLYATSVTDTRATSVTLKTVHDGILRAHLKSAEFV
ncbi:guanine nucleotide binding protein, alpha subunit [Cylindrobasidium torrendii FP15055 ss-10]|uniref:Guanine nucleotide binding protein, alpha subunit n=1 Tax=Cylindrobasidium torrendii FP15055 ss-10 TaxID=1314674 RepID=A0A0D7B840_9AGAR|nr:guanine nucleotide binding protein, alpha subunit [Cylindrobasidium torrendii FP15055 ss-10]